MSSKIKVDTIENVAGSGNVSLGSGHNLVVPGNITGSGTLGVTGASTLTGDLTVDTTTLKVDSSNNLVGIGTSSPLSLTGNAAPGLTISSNGPFILLQDANNANKVRYISNNTGEFQLGQVNDDGSTNKTLHLNISTDGHVTKPLQPVFHVRRVSNQATSNNTNTSTPLEFPTSNAVVSSTHFNHTTHRFTAPVTGKYIFEWGYGTNVAAASVYRTFIWKNGARLPETQLRNDSNGHTGYVYASRSAILSLSVNDYVHLNCSTDSGTAFYSDNELSIFFQGQLIG